MLPVQGLLNDDQVFFVEELSGSVQWNSLHAENAIYLGQLFSPAGFFRISGSDAGKGDGAHRDRQSDQP